MHCGGRAAKLFPVFKSLEGGSFSKFAFLTALSKSFVSLYSTSVVISLQHTTVQEYKCMVYSRKMISNMHVLTFIPLPSRYLALVSLPPLPAVHDASDTPHRTNHDTAPSLLTLYTLKTLQIAFYANYNSRQGAV